MKPTMITDFLSDIPVPFRIALVVTLVAVAYVALTVIMALRDAANSMLVSESALKRDQASKERQRQLKLIQGRAIRRRRA